MVISLPRAVSNMEAQVQRLNDVIQDINTKTQWANLLES